MLHQLLLSLQYDDSSGRLLFFSSFSFFIYILVALADFYNTALTLSPEQAANFDKFIRDCHIKLAAADNVYRSRRLYTDACILKSVYDTSTPILESSVVTQAIAYLDKAIIIAGAAGPGRHDLILDLIQRIQSKHMSQLRPSPLADVSLSTTAPSTPAPVVAARQQVSRFDSPPSLASFQRSIASRPFIVPGHASDWPALNDHPWCSTRYLRTASGPGRVVPVEVGNDYRSDDWSQKLMGWDDFVMSLGQPSNEVLYLAQHTLFSQFPNMRDDITVPDYVYSCPNSSDSFPDYKPPTNDEQLVLNVWFGPRGTISPAHVDPYNNCYVQVVGRKTVWLAPPWVSSALHTISQHNPSMNKEVPQLSNTSRVDVFAADTSKEFPGFWKEVVPEAMTATLEPGDLLFFPPGWWHAFRSEDVSFSVSMWW